MSMEGGGWGGGQGGPPPGGGWGGDQGGPPQGGGAGHAGYPQQQQGWPQQQQQGWPQQQGYPQQGYPQQQQGYPQQQGWPQQQGYPQQQQAYPMAQQQDGLGRPHCQVCGRTAPTKQVTFMQNVGLLVIRFPKTVSGMLCKRCISSSFWQMTLITFFFGWWGVISFFYTLVSIPVNIVNYLGALGLPDE